MKAYKLFRKMKDGYAPLFINKGQRIQINDWHKAENHPTKGFAERFGWHCTLRPEAPHLKTDIHNRVWCEVELSGNIDLYDRPESQGGTWVLCTGELKIVKEL